MFTLPIKPFLLAGSLVLGTAIAPCAQEETLEPIDETLFSDPGYYSASENDFEGENQFKNAIIEGVQFSSEPGEKPDEKVVSCYFIFRDKPSSYFYEVKLKERKIIFEFNDTRAGTSPIPSTAEPPVKGFTFEERKIDINKEVRGLKPEWHNQVRVIFNLEAVPEIFVSDEYNVITYSFKWTTNPALQDKYVVKDNTKKTIIISTASVTGVGLGVLAVWFFKNNQPPKPLPELSIDDLPSRD